MASMLVRSLENSCSRKVRSSSDFCGAKWKEIEILA